MIYGYARISTKKQKIEAQISSILKYEPTARIYQETFTGTKFQERKELQKLLKIVKPGDTIIFDSVSRMSRNAEEGFELYEDLYKKNINLVFIKEPAINTDTYKKALEQAVPLTGTTVDIILEAINKYLMILAKEQIKLAFKGAQTEVDLMRERTKDGIEKAREAGKQIGGVAGRKLTTKKSIAAKEEIKKYARTFGGPLTDKDAIKVVGISRNSYFKYKKELLEELK